MKSIGFRPFITVTADIFEVRNSMSADKNSKMNDKVPEVVNVAAMKIIAIRIFIRGSALCSAESPGKY